MTNHVLVFFLCCLLGCLADKLPEVVTPHGTVRGYYMESLGGQRFNAFEGIPYAKPPVGKLRFEEPQPLKEWEGVWIANETVRCLQYSHFKDGNAPQLQGQEDCLFVNIYTPLNATSKSKLDVIIHIHGGAFMFGGGHVWSPHFLLDHNVVYINLNYRLGPLGFLSTGDEVVPGNNGLKDQSMALRWIKKNIKHFGGNKNSITLVGLSAGGASVTYHYISPMSNGLFNKGYAFSGVNLNPWAQTENAPSRAKQLGAALGCDTSNSNDMIRCMKKRPAHQIVHNIVLFLGFLYNPFTPFGPVIEPPNKNPFLTKSSYELLNTGQMQDLPLILSTVEAEGLYPAAEFVAKPNYLGEIDNQWEELAPFILDYNETLPVGQRADVAEQIRNYYMKDEPISEQSFDKLVKMVSDRLFISTCERAALLFAKSMKSKVYYVRFSYRGLFSNSPRLSMNDHDYGVSHADDLMYMHQLHEVPEDESFKKMINIYTNLLVSFAKTSIPKIPNIEFKPLNPNGEQLDYLHIESPAKMTMKRESSISNRQFWESLPFRENENLT